MYRLDAKRFISVKSKELKTIFHKELDALYGKDEVENFFFLTSEYYYEVTRLQLVLEPNLSFTTIEVETFFNVLERLKEQQPIQYILGETHFFGLKFKVNNNVLIPRPETEELVDWVLQSLEYLNQNSSIVNRQLNILDIGTGSGCIAISLAKHLPNAKVYALDVSKDALNVAKTNARLNDVTINFIQADILDEANWNLQFENLEFDVIVSNPPYVRQLEKVEIKPNVLDNEPHLALFVEDKQPLVFYDAITNFSVNYLKPQGQLYFEINQYLGKETKQLLVDANFEAIELRKDLNGNDRMLKGINN